MKDTNEMLCIDCGAMIQLTKIGNGQCPDCTGYVTRISVNNVVKSFGLRSHDQVMLQAGFISASLREVGQVRPITGRFLGTTGFFLISDGFCRLEALKWMGEQQVYVWTKP